MPRLSLYRPEKSNDYEFIDNQVYEIFTVGGTDLHIHKYLGSDNPSDSEATADIPQYDVVKETNIQDLLFLENRDRKYDADIYKVRGIYNVQDIDFDLSQFGLFLSNDTLFLTVHIRSIVKTIGRKPIAGDVIELPHLKDEYALNDFSVALKRFYVIEDVNRAAEGFSPTWYPHLYRLKLKQIYDSQEYSDILDLPASEDSDNTLRDVLSTYEKEMQINNAIISQAEADAALSGYDISHYYTLSVNQDGSVDVFEDLTNTSVRSLPIRQGYSGYLTDNGEPPNGSLYGTGINFPQQPEKDDYFLRTDFFPKRLFQFDGIKWVYVSSNVRETLTNTNDRKTQIGTFVNNTTTSLVCGESTPERQSLSEALRPKADN